MKPSNIVQPVQSALLLFAVAILFPLGCSKPQEAPAPEVYVQAVHPVQGSISEQITADRPMER